MKIEYSVGPLGIVPKKGQPAYYSIVKSRKLDAYFSDKIANIQDYLQWYRKTPMNNESKKKAPKAAHIDTDVFDNDDSQGPHISEEQLKLNQDFGNDYQNPQFELNSFIIKHLGHSNQSVVSDSDFMKAVIQSQNTNKFDYVPEMF